MCGVRERGCVILPHNKRVFPHNRILAVEPCSKMNLKELFDLCFYRDALKVYIFYGILLAQKRLIDGKF